MNAQQRAILFGRDRRYSKRSLLGAASLVVTVAGFRALRAFFQVDVYRAGPFDVIRDGLIPLWIITTVQGYYSDATVQAYYNDGRLPSWSPAFAAVAGAVLNGVGVGMIPTMPGFWTWIVYALVGGVVGAAVVGTSGFPAGAGGRQLRSVLTR